jgi:Icc-related predicted phosphoesterase
MFAADLHGRVPRYRALCEQIRRHRPEAVLLGGDLLPHALDRTWAGGETVDDFVSGWLAPAFAAFATDLRPQRPEVLLIPGNDDRASFEDDFLRGEERGLWRWIHGRIVEIGGRPVLGYGCVPPTPFGLKDWERYDVSHAVDPGCVAPDEGVHSPCVELETLRYATIVSELEEIVVGRELEDAICLFHSPPYQTCLDRAGLDGRSIDHVPLDVHVGSIAIRRFLELYQPAVALSGHVHEAARLTGSWRQRLGETWCMGAAHDGRELCLVSFDPDRPGDATRELIDCPD